MSQPEEKDVVMTDEKKAEEPADKESQALAAQLQAEEDQKTAQEVEEENKGTPITSYVKQDVVKQLEEMGFSKHASEKALFMTQQNG